MYKRPLSAHSSISDFFFYINSNDFITKFNLINISSQIIPESNDHDLINIIIFDQNGNITEKIKENLKPFEVKQVYFSDLTKNPYGSFLVFHNFDSQNKIIQNNSFSSERGYVGYKKKNSVWNFVHGNGSAFSYSNDSKLESVKNTSLINQTYTPQLLFDDCDTFELIFNNPLKQDTKIKIYIYNKEQKVINTRIISLSKYSTRIVNFKDQNIFFLEISSKIIFYRPIIIKYYNDNFDIFHG